MTQCDNCDEGKIICPNCHGTGYEPGTDDLSGKEKCGICDGKGSI
jgi:DnaJ-class molecular chaperone